VPGYLTRDEEDSGGRSRDGAGGRRRWERVEEAGWKQKKETRTKGGGGTQIAAAKKAHAFSLRGSFNSFSPRFRLFPRNLEAKLLSLCEHP